MKRERDEEGDASAEEAAVKREKLSSPPPEHEAVPVSVPVAQSGQDTIEVDKEDSPKPHASPAPGTVSPADVPVEVPAVQPAPPSPPAEAEAVKMPVEPVPSLPMEEGLVEGGPGPTAVMETNAAAGAVSETAPSPTPSAVQLNNVAPAPEPTTVIEPRDVADTRAVSPKLVAASLVSNTAVSPKPSKMAPGAPSVSLTQPVAVGSAPRPSAPVRMSGAPKAVPRTQSAPGGAGRGAGAVPIRAPSAGRGQPVVVPKGATKVQLDASGGFAGEARRDLQVKDALDYLNQVKIQFGDDSKVYSQFLDIMKAFQSRIIGTPEVMTRVKGLFKGHSELVLGFNTFLPPGYRIELDEESHSRKNQKEFEHACKYVSRIKGRFEREPRIYREFLDILQRYQKEKRTIAQVKEQVRRLFRNQTDLLDDFNEFLPEPARSPPRSAGKPKGRVGKEKPGKAEKPEKLEKPEKPSKARAKTEAKSATQALFDKLKKRLVGRGKDNYGDFLKCLALFNEGVFQRNDLLNVLEGVLTSAGADIAEEFKAFVSTTSSDNTNAATEKEERDEVPIAIGELDFSQCESSGISYKRIPADYELPKSSGRTMLCSSVLNDIWVSVASGTEDFSFTQFRKNQYEEALFRCEDDRFELDMLIETNLSTIRALESLLESTQKLSSAEKLRWQPPTPFKPSITRNIERVYGERSGEMLEEIRRVPGVVLPIIVPRLRQKDVEWRRTRREMNKIWAEVYEKNYHKSLDHRSFYFKQADKKSLSQKTTVNELRNAGEQEFSMPDARLHADLARLIMVTAATIKNMSVSQRRRLRAVWLGFVSTFFGISLDIPPVATSTSQTNTASDAAASSGAVDSQSADNAAASADAEAAGVDGLAALAAGAANEVEDDDPMDEDPSSSEDESGFELDEGEDHAGFSPLVVPSSIEGVPAKAKGRVLLGGPHMVFFFRLYQLMYDRLAKASDLAGKVSTWKPGEQTSQVGSSVTGGKQDGPVDRRSGERPPAYESFLLGLEKVAKNEMEVAKFEDECRIALGTASFELFTLDKVVERLVQQVIQMCNDPSACRLLSLPAYEAHRSGPDRTAYFANAVRAAPNEELYLFAWNQGSSRLTLSVCSATGSFDPPQRGEEGMNAADAATFLTPPTAEGELGKTFLRRCLRATAPNVSSAGGLQFWINNGGDLKYVAGSWDIVRTHRPAGVKGHRNETARSAISHSWIYAKFPLDPSAAVDAGKKTKGGKGDAAASRSRRARR